MIGNARQRGLIEIRRRVHGGAAKGAAKPARGFHDLRADPHGVDPHPRLRGELRCFLRADLADVIGAVRKEDKDPVFRGSIPQMLHRKANRVAYGRFSPGDAQRRFLEQRIHRGAIEGEGRLQVGAGSKKD